METQTLNKTTTEQEQYSDLSQYQSIPALDEAIAEIEAGEVDGPMTIEEFKLYLEQVRWEVDNEI